MKTKRILVAGLALATAVGTNAMIYSPTFADLGDIQIVSPSSYDITYGEDGDFSITLNVRNRSNNWQEITECTVDNARFSHFTADNRSGSWIDRRANNVLSGCSFSFKDVDGVRDAGTYEGTIGVKYREYGGWWEYSANLEISVEINPETVEIPTTDSSFVYDGDEKAAVFTPEIDTDLVELSGDVTGTDAGEYNYVLSLKDNTNYQWADETTEDKEGSWEIKKADLDLSLEMADWTYGEEASEPVLTGNIGEGEVEYSYSDIATGVESEEVPVNAGEYEVCAAVAETKNYNGGEACADFTINKREVTVVIKGETGIFTYDGLRKSVGGYTADEISDELYAKEGSFFGDEETFKPLSAIKVGTYVDDVTAENFINNNDNFDVTFEVTPSVLIIKEPVVVAPTVEKTTSSPVSNPNTGVFTVANETVNNDNSSANIVMATVATITACGIAVARRIKR